MLRHLRSLLFRRRPPARLAVDAEISGDTLPPSPLRQLDISQLTGICEAYWTSLAGGGSEGADGYNRYVHAINELATRDRQILPWVIQCLDHHNYDAREQAAFLIGELSRRGQLHSDETPLLIERLGTMATRPWLEDPKEVQANTAAVMALGKINDPRVVSVLREIILSPGWAEDELSWDAACTLGRNVDHDFEQAEDPVAAAREWLKENGKE